MTPYPGLVMFLHPDVLSRHAATVRVNTRASRSAQGAKLRPFLVLAEEADGWLCVPLFSSSGPGSDRVSLDWRFQAGGGRRDNWGKQPSYFSAHQFWITPADVFREAAQADLTPASSPKTYALGIRSEIDSIIAYRNYSDTDFHPLSEEM